MALFLKASHSLQTLAGALVATIYTSSRGVFSPDFIVTQTEGMNNYLRLQLAEQTGISANCKYIRPNDLIDKLYWTLDGRHAEVLSGSNIRWLLFKMLGTEAFISKFPHIAKYYKTEGTAGSETKRLELAEKTADLFDQYQIYRPGIIEDWNKGKIDATNDTHRWQSWLWRAAKAESQNLLPDKTTISEYIKTALTDEKLREKLRRRMPVIYLFGISIVTPFHIEILEILSEFIDVHFYLLDPAPGIWWYEDRNEKQLAQWRSRGLHDLSEGSITGHPLLTSCSRVIQDTFKMLFRYDTFLNNYEALPTPEKEVETLLQKVQSDIHQAACGTDRHPLSPADLKDGSLTINACYTPVREVQTLYNFLIHQLRNGARLAPRDIVVLVNDVEVYAPCIKAVFDNAPHPIRYTIADESAASGDSLADALSALLQMTEEKFRAEEVVQLLDYTAIRRRFGITDIEQIRKLIDAANIRFGFDGEAVDDTRFVSWRYGLQRIVFGLCMSGGEACNNEEDEELYPLDILEGKDGEEAIRLCHFSETLMSAIEERRRPRAIAEWVLYIEKLVADLVFELGEEVDEAHQELLDGLTDYNNASLYMGDRIPFEVFSRSFLQTLRYTTRQEAKFGTGGVTFCSMIPMRSVPFKVVAMLGMDGDKFPRRDTVASFNIMSAQREVGDRSMRENDRHLFLETLLSAGEKLYISYIGRCVKENTPRDPSSLVEEVLSYIEGGLCRQTYTSDAREELLRNFVTLHPLHPFNSRYNNGEDHLYNYLQRPPQQQEKWTREQQLDPIEVTEVTLPELLHFYKNNLAVWYGAVLGIRYNDGLTALPETEKFSLDKLEEWGLKKELLQRPHDAKEVEIYRRRRVKKGELPLGSMSEVVLQKEVDKVAPVRKIWESLTGGEALTEVPFEIDLNGFMVRGTLEMFGGNRHIYTSWSSSKSDAHHKLKCYIHHLCRCAAGGEGETYYLSAEDKSARRLIPLSPEEARSRISQLVALYEEGHNRPLPFAKEFAGILPRNKAADFSAADLSAGVEKAIHNFFLPVTDPFILQQHREGFYSKEETAQDFVKMCRVVVQPLDTMFEPA